MIGKGMLAAMAAYGASFGAPELRGLRSTWGRAHRNRGSSGASYSDWRPHKHQSATVEAAAEAKREHKAAKRRRDAELTRLGAVERRARLVADAGDAMRRGYTHYDGATWADDAWDRADRAEVAMIWLRQAVSADRVERAFVYASKVTP